MNLQTENALVLLIATLLGLLPNLILKLIDKIKDKQDITKSSLESADLSMDILQDALKFSREEIIYLTKQIREKEEEQFKLEKEIVRLKNELRNKTTDALQNLSAVEQKLHDELTKPEE